MNHSVYESKSKSGGFRAGDWAEFLEGTK